MLALVCLFSALYLYAVFKSSSLNPFECNRVRLAAIYLLASAVSYVGPPAIQSVPEILPLYAVIIQTIQAFAIMYLLGPTRILLMLVSILILASITNLLLITGFISIIHYQSAVLGLTVIELTLLAAYINGMGIIVAKDRNGHSGNVFDRAYSREAV